ncbi:acetyl-CoA hydrolase/transferase C-terminal domain-containing protein [Enterovirga sp.]|uniref:acetyl-CoA hydrolase/transferase family protein n=1 Tax=Enterovirga sp. TaxID=2026350 RepID=UPI002C297D61|nr:acetyl-CoA hydrolase/transferase C-terminal domain-containing protein [Enterovirga sp.]HMO30055.1 acetyl-CoA hydrolase/transferase C-terminal domain-containing protein [Enterovirga sp.]
MAADLRLSTFIRPGDTLMWGQSQAEPATLIRHLVAQRREIGRVRLFLGVGHGGRLLPEHADAFDFLAYCGAGTNRKLAEAGLLDILPVHYSHLPRLIETGSLRIDVLMLQVSPPDEQGRHSLGIAREYLLPALAGARAVLGEVNPAVPWTHGGPYLREADFALLIPSDEPLRDEAARPPSAIDLAVVGNVAGLIEDGATLQVGIGAIPDAALAQLAGRRDLGIHSGTMGDGVAALWESGAVTNARKSIDPGIAVTGLLLGGERIRRFVHRNPAIEMRGTGYTHDPQVLGRIERFAALNSAIEVDLTGQVNSEVAAGRYLGGIGGIVDFLRAAGASRGGVPIIALPSTGGGRSRIVPALSGPVTVPRSDACVIVTEYGVADLRGASLRERPARLIAIAHPDHRESLARAAHAGERD